MIKYLNILFITMLVSCKKTPDLSDFRQKAIDIYYTTQMLSNKNICQQNKEVVNEILKTDIDSLPKVLICQGENRAENCTIFERMSVYDQDAVFKLSSLNDEYRESKKLEKEGYTVKTTYRTFKRKYKVSSEIFDRTVMVEIFDEKLRYNRMVVIMLLPEDSFK